MLDLLATAPTPAVLLVAGAAVALGAAVQGAAGFGLGLLAAPVLALADPSLVPVTMLVVTAAVPVLTLARELAHVDWRGVGWAVLGRLPGTAVGTWAVVVLPARAIAAAVAVAVLGGVAASTAASSSLRWHPAPTPRALLVGGFVSGAAGTATAIGGPPVALLYQRAPGPRVRATLAAFFLAGIVVSVAALAGAGQVAVPAVVAGVLLLPAVALGFALSGPLRPLVDRGRVRPVVLALATASAVVLLVRSLLG